MTIGRAEVLPGEFAEVFAALWQLLADAVGDVSAPLRTPVVIGLGGGAPDGRVMVLRGCDREHRQLVFHTDLRSPKVADLAQAADVANAGCADVAIVGYDPARLIQLRLHGRARLETVGEPVDAAWRATSALARRNYATGCAPGAVLAVAGDGQPAVPDEGAARQNFARVVVEVGRIDWLSLAASGHRRAVFSVTAQHWTANWRVP